MAHKIDRLPHWPKFLSLNLPRPAFLPGGILSEKERADFVMRRDRVFALCTPSEQRQLMALAQRFDGNDPLGFVTTLEALLIQGEADVLFGVVHFLRMLPVQVGMDAQREPLKRELERLAAACAEDARVAAMRRFAALRRCALWSQYLQRWTHEVPDLGLHTWRQLLALLQEDASAAIQVVDEHWELRRSPQLFGDRSLHEDPQLACRIALALRPHRPEVAAALLGDAIFHASFQRKRLCSDEAGLAALEQVMDDSCALLAEWTLADGALGVDAALAALQELFQFGDPAQPYWRLLPQRAMALLPAEHPQSVRTLACVAFYSPASDPLGAKALEMLENIVRGLTADAVHAPLDSPSRLTDFFQFTLSRLEDKVLSARNRRMPAQPDHELLHTVDRVVDELMARVAVEMPEEALRKRLLLVEGLDNEILIRKHHRLLREEFEGLAQAYPRSAGRMMKRLIKYCAYSQVDDEMYKRDLCAESFYLLLPVLDAISPADAAVAREGIDWYPRERGDDLDE